MQLKAEDILKYVSYEESSGLFRWRESKGCRKAGQVAGAVASGYIRICINGKQHHAHRLAWLISHGDCPDLIDHINGDRSDNRLINLRPCNKSENACNAGFHHDSKTKLKGVHFNKRDRRYVAQITKDGKRKCLGSFTSAIEAKKAYDHAAIELHGEFHQ